MTSGNAKELNRAGLSDRPIERLRNQVDGIFRKTVGSWRFRAPRRVVTGGTPISRAGTNLGSDRRIRDRIPSLSTSVDSTHDYGQLADAHFSLLNSENDSIGLPVDDLSSQRPVVDPAFTSASVRADGKPAPTNLTPGIDLDGSDPEQPSAVNAGGNTNKSTPADHGAAEAQVGVGPGNPVLLTPSRDQVQVWLQNPNPKCTCLGPKVGPWFDEIR